MLTPSRPPRASSSTPRLPRHSPRVICARYRKFSTESPAAGSLEVPSRSSFDSTNVRLYAEYLAAKRLQDENKPGLLLAQTWTKVINPTNYWISEKLDGVRSFWNGKAFISRLGNELYAPDWFKSGLPTSEQLDGELFGGRGTFQKTVGTVKSHNGDWTGLTFQVFDLPSRGSLPFEDRMKALEEVLKAAPKHVVIVPQEQCKSPEHLKERLAKVEAQSGEGLMLRMPTAPYIPGRSWTLLKVKSSKDAEARVVAITPGTGKYSGAMGSVKVQLVENDKIAFSIGSGFSDEDRCKPPFQIGDLITFRYNELTKAGVPRFPRFLRKATPV